MRKLDEDDIKIAILQQEGDNLERTKQELRSLIRDITKRQEEITLIIGKM